MLSQAVIINALNPALCTKGRWVFVSSRPERVYRVNSRIGAVTIGKPCLEKPKGKIMLSVFKLLGIVAHTFNQRLVVLLS